MIFFKLNVLLRCIFWFFITFEVVLIIKTQFIMAVLKVIEVLSNSEKSWEDAAQKAVTHAGRSLTNIRSI